MIQLEATVLAELTIGLFLWWTAIYLFTQNPFSRVAQLAAGLLASVSFYFSGDLFLSAINSSGQYELTGTAIKLFVWSMYLPMAFLYHASFLLIPEAKRQVWQKISLYLVYISTGAVILLEVFTNTIRNYDIFLSPEFRGNLADATGKHFYLVGLFLIFVLISISLNLYKALKSEKPKTEAWYKFVWPFWGITTAAVLGPIILLSYYKLIPHLAILPVIDFALIILPLTYSIVRYNLFIDEAKVVFGRSFFYSTLAILLITIVYFLIISLGGWPFDTVYSLILPFVLGYLLIASHPIYEWVITFLRDLVYKIPAGFSLVNDEEVQRAIKDYNSYEKLEDSSLLRLKLIEKTIRMGKAKTPVDALRLILRESVEYFRPEKDEYKRIKANIKYHLLTMLTFDQAEEGQILWELGFDEYPVKILTQENNTREPLFKTTAPSDYSYKSRNAYLALKKEAIHDVVWRISYMEKQVRKTF